MGSRAKLDLYAEFLSRLHQQKHPQLFLSYYQEIYEGFLELFLPENLHYRAPQYLENLGTYCATMQDSGLKELKDPVFKRAFQELNLRRIAVNFYTGDISGALLRLNLELKDFKLDSNASNQEKFLGIYAYLIQSGIAIPEQLEEIRVEWEVMAGGASDEMVWIPLVEKGQIEAESGLITATIQPLKVEVELRRRDATRDLIFFNNHPMGNNDLIYYQAMDAVSVAKKKQLKTKNGVKSSYFRVMFGFPDTGYFYTGESFGLGMSLAALAQMEKVTLQRTQHKILKNAVITGGVDVNGSVRGISELSLPAKIAAFYYSPFQTFVHPDINKNITTNTFEELKKACLHEPACQAVAQGRKPVEGSDDRNPEEKPAANQRQVETNAANSVSSLLKNQLITKKEKISFKVWSKAHIRKNQVLHYVSTILLLVGLGWGSWFYTRDLNVVRVEVTDNILTAFNGRDQPLWTYELFPYESIKSNISILGDRSIQVVIDDINGDSQNEIILSPATIDEHYAGHLICLNNDGNILWDTDFGGAVLFGDSSYKPPFIADDLKVAKLQDGKSVIIALFNHYPYFPAKIALVSNQGENLGMYYHGGSLSSIDIFDVSQDGVNDIVFCGTNNESRDGILGALELTKVSGHSPQQKDHYRHSKSSEANHIFYLRFPKGDWLDLKEKSQNFAIHHISKAGENDFRVTVSNKRMKYYAIYEFGKNMDYHGASFADNMLDTYLTLHDHGLYQDYSPEFVREKLDAIKSWDGSQWVDFLNPEELKE